MLSGSSHCYLHSLQARIAAVTSHCSRQPWLVIRADDHGPLSIDALSCLGLSVRRKWSGEAIAHTVDLVLSVLSISRHVLLAMVEHSLGPWLLSSRLFSWTPLQCQRNVINCQFDRVGGQHCPKTPNLHPHLFPPLMPASSIRSFARAVCCVRRMCLSVPYAMILHRVGFRSGTVMR